MLTQEQTDAYFLAAFKVFEQNNLGVEVVWNTIAERAQIPEQHRTDIKNLMYHYGYMHKTRSVGGLGDLVRGDPSITAARYNLTSHEREAIMLEEYSNTYPAPKKTSNAKTVLQKIGVWIISNMWQFILLTAATIVAAYFIFKFRIPH